MHWFASNGESSKEKALINFSVDTILSIENYDGVKCPEGIQNFLSRGQH